MKIYQPIRDGAKKIPVQFTDLGLLESSTSMERIQAAFDSGTSGGRIEEIEDEGHRDGGLRT